MPPNPASSAALGPADLARIELFAALEVEQQQRLLENHRPLSLAADQTVVLEQDESQGIFLLRSGLVKVRCFDLQGEETVLAVLGPGEVCGEMAVLNPQGLRTADVVTLTPCSLVILRAGPCAGLLHSEPRLSLALAQLLLQGERGGAEAPPSRDDSAP